MFYIAKRHVPRTCEHCGKYAEPAQSTTKKCFAGSYLWSRGSHMQCLLHFYFGYLTTAQLYDTAPLFAFIKKEPGSNFQGREIRIPLRETPGDQYRTGYDRIFRNYQKRRV